MIDTFEFKSRVGADGVLDLRVPLGQLGAGTEVVVTIRPIGGQSSSLVTDPVEWHRLANELYGFCAGLNLERADQGEFEMREPIE